LKIALITDTHWGVRQDSLPFLYNNKQFLENIFFPTIDAEGLDTIIHLGDLLDRRKYINFYTLQRMHQDFLTPVAERNLDFHFIVGNHDIFYKNSMDVLSIEELGLNKPNHGKEINIYRSATEVVFDGLKCLFVPWICDENREDTHKLIGATDATVVLGHLELAGFEMYKGLPNYDGEDKELYSRFSCVLSGHYHHKSSVGHIHYLGSHAEFTWADYNDPRGFHIFDSGTQEIRFIANPFRMFHKVFYDDKSKNIEEVLALVEPKLKDAHVKVIVVSKVNPFWFDMFMSRIGEMGPIDVQVVDDHFNMDLISNTEIMAEAEDTLSFIRKSIETSNLDKKEQLDKFLINLYNEAVKSGV
jgi:hypothetical protein